MSREFWDQAWSAGRIGFHQPAVNPDLERAAPWFLDDAPHRVLVPLCGKTVDMHWLAARGHEVVGVEITAQGVEAFFAEAGLAPEVRPLGPHTAWRAGRITVLQGDIFDLAGAELLPFDRIWDRAAMIALPPELRPAYQRLLAARIEAGATLLLNVLEYDTGRMNGPPFSVAAAEVEMAFIRQHVRLLDQEDQLDDRWRERGHDWITRHLFRVEARPR
jgi:thiopurine S-methyltransferase